MKHNFLSRSVLIFCLSVILPAAVFAQQQSLGDAARQARKNKQADPAKKVITNDDLAPGKSASDTSASSPTAAPAADASKAKSDDKSKLSGDDQAKLDKEWQDKISAQKDQIALLERELDVLQRENKLRAATFYADAGNRLRDEKKYAEEDRKYHDDIAAKQKAIDDAKTTLEQMKDDARKAGASPSAIG